MSDAPANATVTQGKGRIGALDTLRGIALIAMASYHFTWDLEMFGYLDPGTATQGWWRLYARAIASSFLFLAGFSLYLAHRRGVHWPSFGKRFAMVLDGKVLSAPSINEPILGGSAQISGSFSVASANALAISLRSGALPVKMAVVEERVRVAIVRMLTGGTTP
jgi:hypothetical protein